MFDNSRLGPEGRGSVASFQEVAALLPQVIGHIQTVIGSGTLARACGIAGEVKVGTPVCTGHALEIAADGRAEFQFIDGTTFNLSSGARMVLDEFVCDANGTSHSALFGVSRGTFSFVVGQVAKTGCLRIDTPVGSIQGRAGAGGIGMLSLTALIFSVLKEVQAAEFSSHRPLLDSLDDDNIKPKDLELNGVIELFLRDGRHYILDDPGKTFVIGGSGSISLVTNSAARMAELRTFQQDALASYGQGFDANPKAQFTLGTSGNNLADIGNASKAAGDTAFDLTVPGIGKGTTFTASITDHAAEMLFFLHATAINGSPLIEDSVAFNLTLSTAGTIVFSDVSGSLSATFALKSTASSPVLPGFTNNISQIGTFALTSGPSGVSEVTTDTGNTGTVGWSFTLPDNDPVLQSLAEGQTITQIYTVTITDNNGALVTKDVTVTLVGTNDTPVITAATNGAVTEDATTPNLSTTGTITFADVDKIDTHSVSAVADAGNTLGGTLTPVVTTDATGGVAGTVTWTYTVADNATDYLAVGQTATEKFTVTVSDGHGGTASQLVTITINGTNEAPTISAHTDGAVTEDATTPNLSTTGTITFADVDKIDTHSVSAVADAGNLFNDTATTEIYTLSLRGALPTLTWTYTVADNATDYLAVGQTATEK